MFEFFNFVGQFDNFLDVLLLLFFETIGDMTKLLLDLLFSLEHVFEDKTVSVPLQFD